MNLALMLQKQVEAMKKYFSKFNEYFTRKINNIHGHTPQYIIDEIISHVTPYHSEIRRIESLLHGGRATYIGNNRVLTKVVTGGRNFAYIVEADDLLISPWFIITGTYEIPLTDYFLKNVKEESHCLDLGANFGFFSCLLSRLASSGKVICVEADRHVYELCRDNLMINGLQNIGTAIHAAVNDDGAEVELYRRVTRSGNTSIIKVGRDFTDWYGEAPAQPFSVSGLRIDDLLPQMNGKIDFIKIDIEGAEPLAFRGARKTIQENPQLKIVMEWSPGQIRAAGTDPGDFLEYLCELGLQFYTIDKIKKLSKEELLNIDYTAGIILSRIL